MINENQHKILSLPNVQELIKSLDCIPHDSSYETRIAVTKRTDAWLDKLATQTHQPRIITQPSPTSQTDSDIQTWIGQNIQQQGKQWCPF